MIDLDAYFARIGYDGPRTPTLETLRALHALHPAAIPFEAIDVLLDRGIDLDPAVIDAKLIGSARGGYCYEQNSLFKRALTALGFEVEGLIARVQWTLPADSPPRARTHMGLWVTIDDEPWYADVGFGGLVLTAPLKFGIIDPQPSPHETFRLVPEGEDIALQVLLGEVWTPVYQLSREVQLDVDYDLPNWFTSTHPTSHFRHNLMVSRTTPEARYPLLHNRLTIRGQDGTVERRMLSAGEIGAVLTDTFGLAVEPDWAPLFERAVAAGG